MRREVFLAIAAGVALAAISRAGAQADATPLSIQSDAGHVEIKPPKTGDDFGLSAPLVTVDRFSDAAGTLFRRSADPKLPAAGAPFALDDPRFIVPIAGPGGVTGRCYNLDVRPAKPRRYYVFYDTLNNYRLGQFPVIEAIPGDPGYSDLWDIWKVVTPNSFHETNWVRDAETVEKLIADPSSGYVAESTGVFLNAPVVPEGTTASMKGEGRPGSAAMLYTWYKGKRAPILYLEGSLRLALDQTIPTGVLVSSEKSPAWPPRQPLTSTSWPKLPAYTPLVAVKGAKDKPLAAGFIDCPIVGTAP